MDNNLYAIDGLEIDFDSDVIKHIQEHGTIPAGFFDEEDEDVNTSTTDQTSDPQAGTSSEEHSDEEEGGDEEEEYENDDDDDEENDDEEYEETDVEDDDTEHTQQQSDGDDDNDTDVEDDNGDDVSDDDAVDEQAPSEADELHALILGGTIKANGAEHRVASKEEAVQLIQKGMNYEFKMNKLKPVLRQAEALKNNNITDEELNALIAIRNGDTNALNQLIKARNIDVFSLDESTEQTAIPQYVPTNAQFEHSQRLSDALQYVKDNQAYDVLQNEIGSRWSEEAIVKLNNHPSEYYTMVELHKSGDLLPILQLAKANKHRFPMEWTEVDGYAYVRDQYLAQKQQTNPTTPQLGGSNTATPATPQQSTAPAQQQAQQTQPTKKVNKARKREVGRRRVELAGTKSAGGSKSKGTPLPTNINDIDWEQFSQLSEAEQKEIERILGID